MKQKLTIFISLAFFILACKTPESKVYQLGITAMEVTGNKSAKDYFHKGLLLLHSFEYEDAREAFMAAQSADPEMLMAYWGEAMTYNHSLWGEQDFEKGTSVLEKIKSKKHVIVLDMEKDFLNSLSILYESGKTKADRDEAYANFMDEMHKRYPENHEVAAFNALALLGSVQEGRDYKIYGKGANIVKGILAENPNHPGALHYLIHSYDDPDHAKMALDAAFSYGQVAPDASHALHMPSHIYVAMGMWDDVVSANERSYQASLNRMEAKSLGNDARGYHAYHWLEYGYLQQNRHEEAKKMVEKMRGYVDETPSKRGRTHLVFLKGTYLIETNQWDDGIANIPVDITDLNVAVRSQYNYLEGMKAFVAKDINSLNQWIATIESDYKLESIKISNDITICAGASRNAASETNIYESKTMEYQLRGLEAWLEDNVVEAERWFLKSIEIEESLSYNYGPPFIQKPTTELYAEWLISQHRAEEAIIQFDRTLKRAPGRILALKGKKSAAEIMGNEEMIQQIEKTLSTDIVDNS